LEVAAQYKPMSLYTNHVTEVHDVPVSVITRPLPSVLDEAKVQSLMETIQNEETRGNVPPIDVMWVKGLNPENNYYYSFGGCHRWEAHQRLGLPTIPARIIEVTPATIRTYLGGSTPDFK